MIVTVASFKGGVGKSTTSIHLAAWLQTLAPTLCLGTKNASKWAARGGFPFRIAPVAMTAMLARNYDHIVTDTEQAPDDEDLQAMANGSDLLVIPAVPNPSDTDGLVDTIEALRKMKRTNYKVLLTRVTSHEAGDALELRRQLAEIGAPVFVGEIPELKVFRKASGRGVIVSAVKRDPEAKRAWAAYAAVGKELGL